MAVGMYRRAPQLWSLLQCLLGYAPGELPPVEAALILDEEDSDAQYWADSASSGVDAERARRAKHANIKITTILSILTQSRDPRCNALQSTLGVFFHSCNAPERLVKVMTKVGISISVASVRRAVLSMSDKTGDKIESFGRSLLVSYAFDNLDILMKALVPTVDDPHARGMLHLASGTLLRLDHGVTLEDLRCADILWDRSEHNVRSPNRRLFDPIATMDLLYTIHADSQDQDRVLSRQGRFRSWVFQRTLVEHGPAFFSQYTSFIVEPDSVEKIPVTKLEQVPIRAMDHNLSTVAGNLAAIHEIYQQAGVGDPQAAHGRSRRTGEPVVDISRYAVLWNGDMGTFERVLSAIRRRSVENTPYDRLQSMVFVMGLFHFKMAAADAIWRFLVTPDAARRDELGFYKIAAKLRPNDSNHIISNAKFREQHELIHDVGVILRLDAWRTEVARRFGHASLDEWAATQPSLHDIQEVADYLVLNYVEGEGVDLFERHLQPPSARDQVRDNTARTHNYLLHYDEVAYSMDVGDIGRWETVLSVWIPLFRAAGKHKYGTRTLRFIHSLYMVYHERLRQHVLIDWVWHDGRYTIRYNILVNPTGKPGAFRAVDWVVEFLNMLIKFVYGGDSSNYTKERIILESVLVLIYRGVHKTVERNFGITPATTAHSSPNMKETFRTVLEAILQGRDAGPNDYRGGCKSLYEIPDAISAGDAIMDAEATKARRAGESGQPGAADGELEEAEGLLGEDAEPEVEDEPELMFDDLVGLEELL
ncbi:hypothetical protein C8Q77DRAFT_1060511 [Trametes polyzona]|nr:hypothetical protein C8Q77DRAFT_1060511 [Trametes polyzona]